MSSSPATIVSVEPAGLARPGLLQLLEHGTDPRARRGMRHRFAPVLAMALAAVLAGARSLTAIGEWVADADPGVLARLGIAGARRPREATTRRAPTRVDAELLDAVLGAWMRTRVGVLGGRRVIAVDAKTVRGARGGGKVAPHLVAALDHTLGAVLGQVQVAAKSNEIPALRTLLGVFDLVGAVITADATGTQTTTAPYITAPWRTLRAHGEGQPARLVRQVQSAALGQDPRRDGPGPRPRSPGSAHDQGRRRTRTLAGKKSVEVVYVITSMPSTQASPTQIATWVQGHWGTREPPALRSVTSSSTKIAPPCAPATHPGSWRSCAPPRSQRPTPDGSHKHRRSHTTPRARSTPTRRTALDLLKHDFAEALAPPRPTRPT